MRAPWVPQDVVRTPEVIEQIECKPVKRVAADGSGVRVVGARALVSELAHGVLPKKPFTYK